MSVEVMSVEVSLDGSIFILVTLILAVLRIYIEVVQFKFEKLPITSRFGKDKGMRFHRMGFYFSVGYFLLFAPGFLIS